MVRSDTPSTDDLVVRPVAQNLCAVFIRESDSGCALGHIEAEGGRFFVSLEGGELEPYSFPTFSGSVEWFAEFWSASTLGLRN
jgi:hypothetical protein